MDSKTVVAIVLPLLFVGNAAVAQKLTSDIPYIENGHQRHVLDIYTPEVPAEQEPACHVLDSRWWMAGGRQE